MSKSLIFFLFLLSSASHAGGPALTNWAQEREWLKLLHFLPAGSHGKSLVREANFFLHPQGAQNAELELRELWQQLEAEEAQVKAAPHANMTDFAACRFPARRQWLENKAGRIFQIPICSELQEWRKNLSTQKIKLLYASAFINSPASMYGHVLLRLQRNAVPDLKDYTLSFGADTSSAGGLLYIYKSLAGDFPGYFATAPYYLKVREYNDTENRDFWEYEILLRDSARQIIVDHAWELRNRTFDYLFLSRNCAYFIFSILEIADSNLSLLDSLGLWSIPADIIRILAQKKMLSEPSFRPSQEYRTKVALESLSLEEQKLAMTLAAKPEAKNNVDARIWQTAYEVFRWRVGAGVSLKDSELEKEKNILAGLASARISGGTFAPEALPVLPSPPEQGHKSARLGLSGGRSGNSKFVDLAFRAAYHDLLADPAGYDEYSELAMGDFSLRWRDQRIFLQRADLLRIKSIPPAKYWAPKISWNFSLGIEQSGEKRCDDWSCLGPYLEAGAGWSVNPFRAPENSLYAFLQGRAEAMRALGKGWRLSWGPMLGWRWRFTPWWRATAEWQRQQKIIGEPSADSVWRLRSAIVWGKNREMRMDWQKLPLGQEWSGGLYFYF